MFDLTGKGVLVTGATGGIGAAIARVLHGQGANVVISGTREERLTELAGELGDAHGPGSRQYVDGRTLGHDSARFEHQAVVRQGQQLGRTMGDEDHRDFEDSLRLEQEREHGARKFRIQ